MKKPAVLFVILIIAIPSLFAGFSVSADLGALSGVGFSYESKKFDYDLNFETSFPVTSVITGKLIPFFSGETNNSVNYFSYGSKLYKGINLAAFYKLNRSTKDRFMVGLSAKAALVKDSPDLAFFETFFNGVDTVVLGFLNMSFKYQHLFDAKNGIYTSFGIPALIFMHTFSNNPSYYPITICTTPRLYYDAAKAADIDHGFAILFCGSIAATVKLGYSYSF